MDDTRAAARMGRPVRVTGDKPTREKILEAAIDLFARQGYDRTTMRQIAGSVGLTESAVYRHFPGKEAILEEILAFAEKSIYTPLPIEQDLGAHGGDSVFRGLLAPLPEIMASNPSVVRIARIMYAEMHHNGKIRRYFQREYLERADDHMERLFTRCIEGGVIRACDPRTLARVFNAFRSEWAFRNYVMDHEKPVDADALRRDLEASIMFFEQFLVRDRGEPATVPPRDRA